jgi:DNA-binding transcriptional regulator GbsR (MarR family)
MTEDQHRFVEDMGQHMVGYGVPRNTGRVYGYLLLQTRPAGLDEITAELEMAKSGASVATRQLVGFGLARGIGERGSRRLLYEAVHEVEGILAARDAQVADLLAKLRQGARAAPPGPGRERLAEMAEMLQELVDEIPALMARIRLRRQT